MLAAMDDERIEILSRETGYSGFFRIDRYRLRHRKYDGSWTGELTREVFERGHAAAALLWDERIDAVVLIEQFRLPAYLAGCPAWQLEIVAGIIDRDETPEAVARREIVEETGLAPIGELVPIHRIMPSAGGSTETVHLFLARVDASGAGGIHGLKDENEDIRVVVLPFEAALARAEAGGIQNSYALVALWWLAAHRQRLRSASTGS
jgi:ADP-ribose pyrophosphatase